MLTFYSSKARAPVTLSEDADSFPDDVDWIDALRPTRAEIATLEGRLGLALPDEHALSEVESSSRMAVVGDAVLLSMPATVRDPEGNPTATPIGFVVTQTLVVTIRYEDLAVFDKLAGKTVRAGIPTSGGPGATVSILEVVVDHLADVLERAGAELDAVSRRVFQDARAHGRGSLPRRSNQMLGDLLFQVGQTADLTSKVSDSLLVLSRIAPFLAARALPPIAPDLRARLDTIVADAKSLREFQDHLSGKTAFLLDALLGLTTLATNNVFRVLTVASVIAITPTFLASMYGMNFQHMPELGWTYGYLYALSLIACSAIAPAAWFKAKGWW